MSKSHHSFLKKLSVALVAVTTLGLTGQPAIAQAASITPSANVLKQSNQYYKKHRATLAKRYLLDYSAQISLSKTGVTKVYLATTNADVKKSATLAMSYWNSKLGRKAFVVGTKKSHTMTVSLSKATASSNDRSDAWWVPAKKLAQLRLSDFNSEKASLKNAMMNRSEVADINTANRNIDSYAQKVANQPNASTLVATYRKAQITKVQKALTAELNDITKNHLDNRARIFEYADTLAHEFGHSLGLKHSPNKSDLMYWQSGTAKIYDYRSVKNSKTGFNLISKTDTNRAKLAIKIHTATH